MDYPYIVFYNTIIQHINISIKFLLYKVYFVFIVFNCTVYIVYLHLILN